MENIKEKEAEERVIEEGSVSDALMKGAEELIYTNAEYMEKEIKRLLENNIVMPEVSDDPSPEELDKWQKDMKKYVEDKNRVCADLIEARSMGAKAVGAGYHKGDADLPYSWFDDMRYM